MHKQSFAECHSLATKAPLARPSMHFSSKIPEVSKKNSRSLWGIERSGFFNGQGKWAKGFENQMV